MRIEVICGTLKSGSDKWKRGTVFDDTVASIPREILKELRAEAGTVRLLADPIAPAEIPIASAETENEIPGTEQDEIPTTEDKPETEAPDYIKALHVILERAGSKNKTAKLLDVSAITLNRWLSMESTPKPEAITRILSEAEKRDDQNRDDQPAPGGVEGPNLVPGYSGLQ